MQIALVYNERLVPKRMARVQALAQVLEQRGHDVTHNFGDTFDAARDARGVDCICMCGGDGTARLIIGKQRDPGALPPLAIYPTGTINLLARELDYPRDPHKFAMRIEGNAMQQSTRLATINGEPFLACASVGFDANSVASVSEKLKSRIGRFAYVAALASMIRNWPRSPVTIDAGGETFEAEALFVLRGKFYAGPWSLDREAHLRQDRLRVLALPTGRRRDLAALIFYAVLGSRKPRPIWRFLQTDSLLVSGSDGAPLQADGDIVGATPATIEMTDQSVTFL